MTVSYSTVGSGTASASVPNFSVSYYAKGAIMKKPTVFGMNGMNPMVGGEAGEEAIVPLDSLWSRMKSIITGTFANFVPALSNKQAQDENKKSATVRKKEETERTAASRSGLKNQDSDKKSKTTIIQKLYLNVNMDDMDDFSKLKKLIDEIEGDTPVTA